MSYSVYKKITGDFFLEEFARFNTFQIIPYMYLPFVLKPNGYPRGHCVIPYTILYYYLKTATHRHYNLFYLNNQPTFSY